MEHAVDRTTAEHAAARDDVRVAEAATAPLALAAPPAEAATVPPANPGPSRPFDDIPSVVRALLTGYDEA
jgi:hypothetical protein